MNDQKIGSSLDSWRRKKGSTSRSALKLCNGFLRAGMIMAFFPLLSASSASIRRDLSELLEMLAEGFPTVSVKQFLSVSGFPVQEAARYLNLSTAQLARRRRAGRIGPEGSERLLRLAELYAHTLELL